MYDCQVSLSSPPPHHLFPLFLPSLLPSVFNPAQFAHLVETILVISACNDTLLTPITTIKTLLPLGPFQVLINQMAARGRLPPYTHIHTHIVVLTHTFSPALTDHVAPLKTHLAEQNISMMADKCLHFTNERRVALSSFLFHSHCLFLSPSL